ncbi:MAG: type II toxin-antitoxin system PemK/MazF family toxin [Syntrophorhabdaceae bacterium]|nr:type II toxin-antitoxin system PemK/MazF family toxin [Syntrophorhabdaceae bacterium]
MKSTIDYKKWDIVLVPFPFTDLTTIKKRPALIISPDEYNKKLDVVIVFITSNLDVEYRMGDLRFKNGKNLSAKAIHDTNEICNNR